MSSRNDRKHIFGVLDKHRKGPENGFKVTAVSKYNSISLVKGTVHIPNEYSVNNKKQQQKKRKKAEIFT